MGAGAVSGELPLSLLFSPVSFSNSFPFPFSFIAGKPSSQGVYISASRSQKCTAEERVGRRCGNLRVLNSYWINQDSTYKYYEVICVDPHHNAIKNDARINWIARATMKHRENRGLTSAGRKSRGMLSKKGHGGHALIGGSRRAAWKRRNTTSLHRYR